MIHRDDADRIMTEVRSFYSAGVKSNNKVYIAGVPKNRYVNMDDPFDGKWQNWSTSMMTQKAGVRNNHANLAGLHRPAGPAGESFYEFGRRIYNGGKRAEFSSGNCMEMAAVAAVIAIDDYHFTSAWLYVAAIGEPGDHAFCILSMRQPPWGHANDMINGSSTTSAFVIDPWLNTVCAADEYWDAAQAKVRKWAADGKRIAWSGLDGTRLGWYCPDGIYAQAFGTSPLSFIPIDQTL